MNFLKRKSSRRRDIKEALDCTGPLRVNAVGESFYQEALAAIAGRTEESADLETLALLIPEPNNKFDPNAVGVYVADQKVGHLSREDAAVLQQPLSDIMTNQCKAAACRAKIVGGWDRGPIDRGSFGVILWIDPDVLGIDANDLGARDARSRTPTRRWEGLYQGKHYTEYVDTVKYLRKNEKTADAEELLVALLGVIEKESQASGNGVAPWYYEQLAVMYRKSKERKRELGVLERFAAQKHAAGAGTRKLLERLDRLRVKA